MDPSVSEGLDQAHQLYENVRKSGLTYMMAETSVWRQEFITLRQMQADGVKRAVAFVTSAFGSFSGCRQYAEDIAKARVEVGEGAPEIIRIRPFSKHPKFVEAMTDRVRAALAALRERSPHAHPRQNP